MNVTLIKLGGSLLDAAARRDAVLDSIAERAKRGEEIVVVHGGGRHVDASLSRLGIAKRTHAGLRVTDGPTLEVVVSVLAGTVNKMLVHELSRRGVRALGISGCDASILKADVHEPIGGVDLGHVGRVVSADASVLRLLVRDGVLPVVSSIAAGEFGLLNVNADAAAAALAIALRADTLEFITDVDGVRDGSGSVVGSCDLAGVESLVASGAVSGGMLPKLTAAAEALRRGVRTVAIGEQIHIGEGGTRLVAA